MLRGILSGFVQNARAILEGRSLLWHASAIVLTFILVTSGFDWWFYEQTRSQFFYPIIWAAGIGGFFVPVVIPVGLYIWAEVGSDVVVRKKALAIMQAIILASLLAIIYKIFTGRIQPEFMNTIGNTDISREFQLGFFRNGIFWGWPSSHTAVAVAGGVTMLRLFRSLPVRLLAIVYMIIVAVGAGIGFHWFSDVAAGAIFGVLIASIVSRNLR